MKIISFDVGIKNMAYCVFDITPSSISILDWNVLNLIQSEQPTHAVCNAVLETKAKKKKKSEPTTAIPENQVLCGKKAKYQKGTLCFCEKHAKTCVYKMPTKQYCFASIKKLKVNDLITFCNQHLLFANTENIPISQLKREQILQVCNKFLDERVLEPIKEVKQKTADQTDLVTIGRKIKEKLDELPFIQDLTHVIIENQISPIANRMKTIQGMLSQYFIMRCSRDFKIEFVSSANKLKGFTPTVTKPETGDEQNAKYKQHKKDGIVFCQQFLDNNERFKEWSNSLNTTKKDDLADSFLQGIMYLKNKKIISYAENLKINSILLS